MRPLAPCFLNPHPGRQAVSSTLSYTNDRYEFINNFLFLKQAAGTLGFDDLQIINCWLVEGHKVDHVKPFQENFYVKQKNKRKSNCDPTKYPILTYCSKNPTDMRWTNMINQIRNKTRNQ